MLLSAAVMHPVLVYGQQDDAPSQQRTGFKLTVIEDASEFRRAQGGRVSSQAVVQVTDENDVPVAGIAVAFTIPQFVGGGAAFANGALTSVVTTNAAGLASSTFTTAASATAGNFSIAVSASAPGQVLTAAIPVNMSAAAAAGGAGGAAGGVAGGGAAGAGGGISGALIGVLVAVGVAGAVVAAKVAGGGNDSPGPVTQPPSTPRPSISISLGQPSVGAP
jgi:hypothetical protein